MFFELHITADILHANQIINRELPEELTELKPRLGISKLKDLLLETEMFEVQGEEAERGGVWVLKGLKPECQNVFNDKQSEYQ